MEGRCLWIQPGDVDGRIEPGNVVKAARELNDWCLRGDDGSAPVQPGAMVEIVDVRPWGAAQAVEVVGVKAPAAIEMDANRARAIEQMARCENRCAADEWGAWRELKELGVPAARLPQKGRPGAVGVRERVSQVLDGEAPRFGEIAPAVELHRLIEDAAEAVHVHLDVRERLLTVFLDDWSRRDRVPWAETAAQLLSWIVEQVREAMRIRRAVLEWIAANSERVGPLVSPLSPDEIMDAAECAR